MLLWKKTLTDMDCQEHFGNNCICHVEEIMDVNRAFLKKETNILYPQLKFYLSLLIITAESSFVISRDNLSSKTLEGYTPDISDFETIFSITNHIFLELNSLIFFSGRCILSLFSHHTFNKMKRKTTFVKTLENCNFVLLLILKKT